MNRKPFIIVEMLILRTLRKVNRVHQTDIMRIGHLGIYALATNESPNRR